MPADIAPMGRRGFLKLAGISLAGVSGLSALAGCGGDSSAGSAGAAGPIRIAALYPISGPLALLGDESWRGAEIAASVRNANGGVAGRKIEFVKADVPDVNAATSEARRLVTSEHLRLAVGTFSSSLALAASEVFCRSGATYVEFGGSSVDITNRGYKTMWRINPPAPAFTQVQMEFVRDWAAKKLNKPIGSLTIAIAHEDSAYGSGIARSAQESAHAVGVSKVTVSPYSGKATDLSSLVLGLKSQAPDIMLAASNAADAILLGRQIKESGLQVPVFVGTGSGHSLVGFAEALGSAADGVFDVDFTQFAVNSDFTPGLDTFLAEYKKAYQGDPRSGHSLANYMAAQVVFDLLEKTKGDDDPVKFAEAAKTTKIAEGKTANGWGVDFDSKGQNSLSRPLVMQWKSSKLETVWPPAAAVREPELKTPFV